MQPDFEVPAAFVVNYRVMAPARARELRIHCPDGETKTIPLQGDRLTLGRSSTTELCYPDDAGLSRQHLAFEREGGEWKLRDLGSKSGPPAGG
jgi:sigma-B regulation protein RsbU (phosphoserine phosphatase)